MSKSPRRRAVWWFLAALCFVPLAAVVLQTRAADGDVEREVAALRKLGVPTNAAEMRRATEVADADNAAPLYRQAFASLEAHGADMPVGSPTDPKVQAETLKWVSENEPTLALAEQASRLPACDFKRPWEQGIAVLFREYPSMKSLVKLAFLRAGIEAEKGRFDESMRWLEVGDAIAAHAYEPHLIGMLVAIASESMVLGELERQLDAYGDRAEFRKAAQGFLARQHPAPDMRRGLFGEVFFTRAVMGDIRKGKLSIEEISQLAGGGHSGNEVLDKLRFASIKMPIVSARVEAKLLRRYRLAFETMRHGDPMRSQLAASDALDSGLANDQSWTGTLAELFVPVFANAGESAVRIEARRRMSRAGLALWTLHAETGRFPASLPKEPWALDPYTGKPFVYKPGKERFKLYSAGKNGQDDGGAWTTSKARTDDVEYNAARRPK